MLIKPPCCNTKNIPLSAQQVAEVCRTNTVLSNLASAHNKVYIVAHSSYEQGAYILNSKDYADALIKYYCDIWSAYYEGVVSDDSHYITLIETNEQYAELLVKKFVANRAPKYEEYELRSWLEEHDSTIVRFDTHPIEHIYYNETMPAIVLLRQTKAGIETYILQDVKRHNFFDCKFEDGLDASSITKHINYLLRAKDIRLLSHLKECIGSTGTYKAYCLEVQCRNYANYTYFDSWQVATDLEDTLLFDTDELENFITVTL